ncbi:MAG: hypothetical protein QW416_01555 [Candidatus Nitrosocaldaceae archaeon]
MRYKARRPKNWLTALAILLIVVASISLVFNFAIYVANNATEIFIDELLKPEFTQQKIAFITYIIAIIMLIIGYRMEIEL